MNSQTLRLSIENLEDRTTPASTGDLFASAQQSYLTAEFLQQLARDPMLLASPAVRPAVQSYFTGVFEQANQTLALLNEFPGVLPGGQASLVEGLASMESNVAQLMGSRLGFSMVATPPVATIPTPPADSGMTNTMPSATASSWVAQSDGLKIWDV